MLGPHTDCLRQTEGCPQMSTMQRHPFSKSVDMIYTFCSTRSHPIRRGHRQPSPSAGSHPHGPPCTRSITARWSRSSNSRASSPERPRTPK